MAWQRAFESTPAVAAGTTRVGRPFAGLRVAPARPLLFRPDPGQARLG